MCVRVPRTTSNLELPPTQPSEPIPPAPAPVTSQPVAGPSRAPSPPDIVMYDDMLSPAALVEVSFQDLSETQFSPPHIQTDFASSPVTDTATTTRATTATAATRTTATTSTTAATTLTATATTTVTADTTATAATSQRTVGGKRRRQAEDLDEQIAAELKRLRDLSSRTSEFDAVCVHWGNIITSTMQALDGEARRAFIAKVAQIVADEYK